MRKEVNEQDTAPIPHKAGFKRAFEGQPPACPDHHSPTIQSGRDQNVTYDIHTVRCYKERESQSSNKKLVKPQEGKARNVIILPKFLPFETQLGGLMA